MFSRSCSILLFLVALEQHLNVTAKILSPGRCVEVKWIKIESADCAIKYEVTLKDSIGAEIEKSHGYNIASMKMCNILPKIRVISVQLTAQFRTVSKTVTTIVIDEGIFLSEDKIFRMSG